MRVISGEARGRRLKELSGMETRPTTDKVKESIFNIVQFDIEGRKVLDLFGGTGQLGIEALSRGAAECTFVDLRREAAALIRENLKATRLEERGTVVQGEYPGLPALLPAEIRPDLSGPALCLPACWKRRWNRSLQLTSFRNMV